MEAGEETEKIYVKARERYPKKEVVLGRFQRRGAQPITFKYRAEKSKIFGVMKRPVAKV